MFFFRITLIFLFTGCFINARSQSKNIEISFLHTQTTLPWKKLPGHSLHPGVRGSYLWGKDKKRWVKEVELGFQHHPDLYNSLLLGTGIRYNFLKPSRKTLLQSGLVIGLSLDKPTQQFYEESTDGNWNKIKPGWQPKGYLAFNVKAGYAILKNLSAGAGIRIWAEAPYVADFSVLLPHRNYELFFRYHFSNNHFLKF